MNKFNCVWCGPDGHNRDVGDVVLGKRLYLSKSVLHKFLTAGLVKLIGNAPTKKIKEV